MRFEAACEHLPAGTPESDNRKARLKRRAFVPFLYHHVMIPTDPGMADLRRLSERRKPDPDLTLGFLRRQFDQRVARPFKQLESLVPLWEQLVPADLVQHTRLEGLSHGVLRVAVDSSAYLYEVDCRLRQGLQQQLISQHKGPALRRIQLRVDGKSGERLKSGG